MKNYFKGKFIFVKGKKKLTISFDILSLNYNFPLIENDFRRMTFSGEGTNFKTKSKKVKA
jgi:hypothetical protein